MRNNGKTPVTVGGESKASLNVLGVKIRKIVQNLCNGHPAPKIVKDIRDGDPSPADARLVASNARIDHNSFSVIHNATVYDGSEITANPKHAYGGEQRQRQHGDEIGDSALDRFADCTAVRAASKINAIDAAAAASTRLCSASAAVAPAQACATMDRYRHDIRRFRLSVVEQQKAQPTADI